MKAEVEAGTTLTFERFWRWLGRHKGCLLRAGTPDCYLYDQEDCHWQLDEEADHSPVLQLCRAKQLIGEVVLDTRDVLFVQVMPAEGTAGDYLFEVVGGSQTDPYALYHFLLSHGLDETEQAHRGGGLKH